MESNVPDHAKYGKGKGPMSGAHTQRWDDRPAMDKGNVPSSTAASTHGIPKGSEGSLHGIPQGSKAKGSFSGGNSDSGNMRY